MRLIGWLLLILVGLGWLASEVPLAETRPERPLKADWRRTAQGWERPSTWPAQTKIRRPAVHPVVVGLLQLFLALAVLIAFSKDADAARRTADRHASVGSGRPVTGR